MATQKNDMRPDKIEDRPFFREEAEEYRLFRHLGEVILFRPLSLKMLTFIPLVFTLLFWYAFTRVNIQEKFEGVAIVNETLKEGIQLLLPKKSFVEFKKNEQYRILLEGQSNYHQVFVIKVPLQASASEVPSASRVTFPNGCLSLVVKSIDGSLKQSNLGDTGRNLKIWSAKKPFVSYR